MINFYPQLLLQLIFFTTHSIIYDNIFFRQIIGKEKVVQTSKYCRNKRPAT